MDRLARWLARRSREAPKRVHVILASAAGSLLELGVIPYFLVEIGGRIDSLLGLHPILGQPIALILAILSFAIGIPWLGASIYWQHAHGKGTPLPLVPTRKLLTGGPYRYCRNPMNLGAIFWLFGWVALAGISIGAALLFLGVITTILAYIKLIEEKELAIRFPHEYPEYKLHTPFLIPHGRRKRS